MARLCRQTTPPACPRFLATHPCLQVVQIDLDNPYDLNGLQTSHAAEVRGPGAEGLKQDRLNSPPRWVTRQCWDELLVARRLDAAARREQKVRTQMPCDAWT